MVARLRDAATCKKFRPMPRCRRVRPCTARHAPCSWAQRLSQVARKARAGLRRASLNPHFSEPPPPRARPFACGLRSRLRRQLAVWRGRGLNPLAPNPRRCCAPALPRCGLKPRQRLRPWFVAHNLQFSGLAAAGGKFKPDPPCCGRFFLRLTATRPPQRASWLRHQALAASRRLPCHGLQHSKPVWFRH